MSGKLSNRLQSTDTEIVSVDIGLSSVFENWLYNLVLIGAATPCLVRVALFRRERLAWTLLGAALLSWTAGEIYFQIVLAGTGSIPIPSPTDAGYLLFYPIAFAGLIAFKRGRIGERIIAAAPALVPVARLVHSSHERWDGGGYPDGLAGEEIPLGSRIIAACDAFDAMTSERPYSVAMVGTRVLEELAAGAGGQFDPRVADSLRRVIERGAIPARSS
ncbi:MAG: hypothetical protein JST53_06965 [Actinobacteria bacterium]|nr:hypothetical protein [Actinomycetota bacterium]